MAERKPSKAKRQGRKRKERKRVHPAVAARQVARTRR